MKWTTDMSVTYSVEIDGITYPTEHKGVDWIDPKVEINGTSHTLRYAVADEDAQYCNPIDNDDAVKFREFRSQAQRDEFVEAEREAGHDVFIVEKYEHSGVHYSLVNEGNYPDRQWDVAPCAVLSLADFTHPRVAAVAMLNEFNSWCAGDVYGIATETFTVASGEPVAFPSAVELPDIVWGFIGSDYAQETVNGGL